MLVSRHLIADSGEEYIDSRSIRSAPTKVWAMTIFLEGHYP